MDNDNKETIVSNPTKPILPSTNEARNISTIPSTPAEIPTQTPKPTDAQIIDTYSGIQDNSKRIDMTQAEIVQAHQDRISVQPSIDSGKVNVIQPNDAEEIRRQAQALIDEQNAKKPNLVDKIKGFLKIK